MSFSDGFQFCSWRGLHHRPEGGVVEMHCAPAKEGLEVGLADGAYGVDVRTAAVVLGQVPSQPLIHIRTPQDQQRDVSAAGPLRQLCKQVRQHHSRAGLDVLQCQVLDLRSPVYLEPWRLACDQGEERHECIHNHVNGYGQVERPNLLGKLGGPVPRLLGAVFGPHVHRHEDSIAELGRVRWSVRLVANNLACILQHLCIPCSDGPYDQLSHMSDQSRCGGAVSPA
mmetsp:Transcript_15653/g.25970  ORF Transcript_15653/g.25970 Transcript_15653/m.25970 type:complete len:226 (+) Transcript_15653:710-1387(+)